MTERSSPPGAPKPSSDTMSTVDLVALAQGGDRSAVDVLFARHALPLRRWASGRLPRWARDLADTEDLVQEVLLQTFKRVGDFEARGTGSLHAYLRQAMQNRIRDELRRWRRRPGRTDLDTRSPADVPSPLERAIGAEAINRYERALARLRPEEQDAIVARMEMGYTYEELAASLGKPSPDAARKAAHRAVLRLVHEMEHGSG
jgi:RNA polymerase sigma factor (sigma-70 family)